MAAIVCGSSLSNQLNELLTCAEIIPGDGPSYQIAKCIYVNHPIGKKMVDAPISKAQSLPRLISVPDSPEEKVREQFQKVWKEMGCDRLIANAFRISRIYGLSTLCAMVPDLKPMDPIDYPNLWKVKDKLRFNILDPLNTSGSLVLNQDPNKPDFLKVQNVSIAGVPYNISRCVVMQNEDPIYIEWTTSAFGYTGRSVYQRALLPLKSFIQSMITDDLVVIKAGVLIAKIKSPGSIINDVMLRLAGFKRNMVQEARTGNVLSISPDEEIESLDLTSVEPSMNGARKNIMENIAVSADMPAILLNSETFAEGFADGTEDAKAVVEYIDDIRAQMQPLYDYFTKIVQYVAWNPAYYETIQKSFPKEWGTVDFNAAFYRWMNSFAAAWPSLMREPESEQIKKEAVRLESQIALLQTLLPVVDPDNAAMAIQWCCDNFNELKLLFPNPLLINADTLKAFLEEKQAKTDESHDTEIESAKLPTPDKKFGDSIVRLLAAPPGKVRGKTRRPNKAPVGTDLQ